MVFVWVQLIYEACPCGCFILYNLTGKHEITRFKFMLTHFPSVTKKNTLGRQIQIYYNKMPWPSKSRDRQTSK